MDEKGFFARWIGGIKNLSEEGQINVQLSFSWGNLVGFFGGFITMLLYIIYSKDYKFWWTALILLIAFLTTIVDLIGKTQQLKAIQLKAIQNAEDQLKKLEGVML
jgi:uncharacterized membrane protein